MIPVAPPLSNRTKKKAMKLIQPRPIVMAPPIPKKEKKKMKKGIVRQIMSEVGLAGMSKALGFNAESIGAAAGGYLMGAPGIALGRRAGKAFRTVTGLGAYNYSPTLPPNEVPSFGGMSLEDGELVLCKREFISSLVEPANNAGAFIIRTLKVNPGNPLMFAWFSQIAANFEEWVPLGMIVMYVTLSSPINNSGGLGLGSVAMAADYDAYDTAPTSKQYLLQTWKVKEDRPSNPIRLEIECKPSMNTRKAFYIRTNDSVPGDLREYDLCNVFIATEGIPNSSSQQILGDLYVTYRIKLRKPILTLTQVPSPPSTSVGMINLYFNAVNVSASNLFGVTSQAIVTSGSVTSGYLDGGFNAAVPSNSIPGLVVYLNHTNSGSTTNSLAFSSPINMTLLVIYIVKGASTALTTAYSSTLGSGLTAASLFCGDSTASTPAGATSTIQAFVQAFAYVLGSAPISDHRVTLATSVTIPGTQTAATLQIIRIA